MAACNVHGDPKPPPAPSIPPSPAFQGHNILCPSLHLPLLLPRVQEWNQHGVARICHMLTVLQPALASLTGVSSSDAVRQFDKARLYFSLLMYSPEGLQRAIMDKPGRFTLSEYTALLQVRTCTCCNSKQGRACLLKLWCCSVLWDAATATRFTTRCNTAPGQVTETAGLRRVCVVCLSVCVCLSVSVCVCLFTCILALVLHILRGVGLSG